MPFNLGNSQKEETSKGKSKEPAVTDLYALFQKEIKDLEADDTSNQKQDGFKTEDDNGSLSHLE